MTIVIEKVRTHRRDFFWLLVLWIIVTSYNSFKPYHIDDTVHLEIARWISGHPLHPMSGMLNWTGVDEPFYKQNQPHLYFYLIAIWGWIFGYREPAMHALQSLAALASIVFFYGLARALVSPIALWLTAMLAFGPAFIVEQNLMVDVPLLATWLAFFYSLVCLGRSNRQTLRYVSAALACSAALLIKYSSLVLFLILFFSLLFEWRKAQLWCLLIPMATVAAWSIFNYLDYGGVHVMTRSLNGPIDGPIKSLAIWIITLGAITPLGFLAVVESRPELARYGSLIYALVAMAFAALVYSVAIGWVQDNPSDRLLQLCFAANGLIILLWTVWALISRRITDYFKLTSRGRWRRLFTSGYGWQAPAPSTSFFLPLLRLATSY
jgi:Dolichyl-phosphate-mannose-protein mannosyltransferase